MKTSTSYKLKQIRAALKQGIASQITLRSSDLQHAVQSFKNHGHSMTIERGAGNGFIVIDPDDILSVWFPKLPDKLDPNADDMPFEVHIDD